MFRPLAVVAALISLMGGPALAALQLYPIDGIANLPEIDDGTGPLKFDFSPYKLASRYDGETCAFTISRYDDNGDDAFADGEFTVSGGKLSFGKTQWYTGGLATPDSFNRANLALTEKGELVGMLPVYATFVDAGMVPPDAILVPFLPKYGTLAKDMPAGRLTLTIDHNTPTHFEVTGCNPPGVTTPIQPYFDFTKYKFADTYDGLACTVLFVRQDPDGRLQPFGNAKATVADNGHISFNKGYWNTRGPKDSFDVANLAVTAKGTLAGTMMVYPLFPDQDRKIQRGFRITLQGDSGKLNEALAGKTVFPLDDMEGQLILGGCKKPT